MFLSVNDLSYEADQSLTVNQLNNTCENICAESILRQVIEKFRGEIALVSSFGADAVVLLHMASEIDPELPVLFLDTGFHFEETLSYRRALARQLGLRRVRTLNPHATALAELDPCGDLHQRDPNACCSLRKTAVLQDALTPYRAWISGRKRHQTRQRRSMQLFELDSHSRIKVNPLADWSPEDINHYIETRDLPRHPLWGKGYWSIGCAPCTAMTQNSENARSGRWQGCNKTECGIHL